MSGSSMDGLDMALCRFSGAAKNIQWEIIRAETVPYSDEWSERLQKLTGAGAAEFVQADYDYGQLLGKICLDFLQGERVDYIASHGHTIFHFPESGATAQIGQGAVLAACTGFPVVTDFRSGDVALGGQGAPIVAAFDRYAFPDIPFLVNLGGICNLSINLPGETLAYDICPCNQLLNYLARQAGKPFDEQGYMASVGVPVVELKELLLNEPYFAQKGPKSLDNSYVIRHFFPLLESVSATIQDKLSTVCETIAECIGTAVHSCDKDFSQETVAMILSGGGAHNAFLVQRIKEHLPARVQFREIDDLLIDFKEAVMIGFLGYMRIIEQENILSSVTGATRNSIGGAIYLY